MSLVDRENSGPVNGDLPDNNKSSGGVQEITNNPSRSSRKRSFAQVLEESSPELFPVNDDVLVEEIDSDKDNSIILEENPRKKARILIKDNSDSDVPSDFETVSVGSDNSEGEEDEDDLGEDSEKEEIQILSETKLDKAELLRREQQFKKLTCPVCLDTPDIIVATQCGHLFCLDCIIRSLASSKTKSVHMGTCPVCRKNVRYKDLQLLSIKHFG